MLVMEYVVMGSLWAYLHEQKDQISNSQLLKFATDVAEVSTADPFIGDSVDKIYPSPKGHGVPWSEKYRPPRPGRPQHFGGFRGLGQDLWFRTGAPRRLLWLLRGSAQWPDTSHPVVLSRESCLLEVLEPIGRLVVRRYSFWNVFAWRRAGARKWRPHITSSGPAAGTPSAPPHVLPSSSLSRSYAALLEPRGKPASLIYNHFEHSTLCPDANLISSPHFQFRILTFSN